LGVKGGITEELIRGSVQIVGAGPERHVDHRWTSAISCGRGIGLHLEFLDCVHRRVEDQHIGVGVNALNTVEEINSDVGRVAVDRGPTGPPARGVAAVAYGGRTSLVGY